MGIHEDDIELDEAIRQAEAEATPAERAEARAWAKQLEDRLKSHPPGPQGDGDPGLDDLPEEPPLLGTPMGTLVFLQGPKKS
jgi:hypothetical protein